MDSVIFLGGRESSTIKEISENWLGKATISMQTDGRTRGQSESYCIGAFEVPDRRKIPERDILLETRKGVALSYAPTQIAI